MDDSSRATTCPDCGVAVDYVGRGPTPRCPECRRLARNLAARLWRERNLERARASTRQSMAALRDRDPQAARDKKRVHAYGITADQYAEMLAAQGGRCLICGTDNNGTKPMHVDHDHACCSGTRTCGQCVRGLLCNRCNSALGFMADDSDRLRAAADYLDRFNNA